MHLEWQDLINEFPDLEAQLNAMPNGIFSGKEHIKPGTRSVFFCYARPAHDREASEREGEDIWSTEAGDVQWYLYDVGSENIVEDAPRIIDAIRCRPDTPRKVEIDQPQLSDIRTKIEKHIAKTFLRKVQAPVGVKPELRAWMELN